LLWDFGVQSFQLSNLVFSTVAISRSGIYADTCPSQMDGLDGLRISGLQEFLFNTFSFFQSDFSWSGRSFSTRPLQINGPGPLWDFDTFQPSPYQWPSTPFLINSRYSTWGLRRFHPLLSLDYSVPGVVDIMPHNHCKSMALVRYRTLSFGNIKPQTLLTPFILERSIKSS